MPVANPELARQHAEHLLRAERARAAEALLGEEALREAEERRRAAAEAERRAEEARRWLEAVEDAGRRTLALTARGVLLLRAVSEISGVSLDELRGTRGTVRVTRPRQVAYFLLVRDLGLSLPRAGARVGGRDHTTVLHGVRKVEAALQAGDARTAELVAAVRARFAELDAARVAGA